MIHIDLTFKRVIVYIGLNFSQITANSQKYINIKKHYLEALKGELKWIKVMGKDWKLKDKNRR